MACIKKLMIQGIRNYNPQEDGGQLVEFFSPMTLILGQNGTGKTTIIEALKYAITGQFPPNTKHGAFINDPKLSSGFEVKAHVKLVIEDRNGDAVTISRKLKATTKGKQGNVSMSTVESTVSHIKTKPNGTKVKVNDIQSKCCDIQEIINQVVGVSEPILNNVVFVHQEDSYWPLDEASKVKLKFDAIFNTTKYIKALKALQDREKAMTTDIRIARNNFEHSGEFVKEARRKTLQLEEFNMELKAMGDRNTECEKELEKVQQEINRLLDLQARFLETQAEVSNKEGQIQELDKTVREFRKRIKEVFPGNMESLLSHIKNFEFANAQNKRTLSRIEDEKRGLVNEQKRIDDQMYKFEREKGIFEQKTTANEKRNREMDMLLEDLFSYIRSLKENSQENFSVTLDTLLSSFEQNSESVGPNTAIKAFNSAFTAKERQLGVYRQQVDKEEKKLQNQLNELNKSKTTITTQVTEKEKVDVKNKEKLQELKRKLDSLDESGDFLAELDGIEERISQAIERLEKSELTKTFESEIANLQKEIKDLEKKRALLSEQNNLLSQDTGKLERINAANAIKLKKRAECAEILCRIQSQLTGMMVAGEKVPEENLGTFLQNKLQTLGKEVAEKVQKEKKIEQEIIQVETQKKNLVREIEKKQKEILQIKKKAESILEGASFEDAYESIFKETEELQSDVTANECVLHLYTGYIKNLEKKPCCPLCERDFAKEAERKQTAVKLKSKMQQIEISKPDQEVKLKELKEKQDKLVRLKPNWDRKENMEKVEIPDLKKKKEEYENQLLTLKDELDELVDSLNVLNLEKSTAESFQKDAILFDKCQSDGKLQEQEAQRWEAQRNPRVKELTVTLSEVQTELQSIDSTVEARRREKERKEELRNKKVAELNEARKDKNKVVEEKLKISQNLQNRDAMEQQKKELEKEAIATEVAIQDLKKQLPVIQNSISELQREINELKNTKEETLDSIQKDLADLMKKKERVNQLQTEYEQFRVEVEKYNEEEDERRQCSDDLVQIKRTIENMVNEIEMLTGEVNSQEAIRSDLMDNKMLKEREQKREALYKEIEDKRKTIDNAKAHGLSTELNKRSKEKEDINKKISRAKGEIAGKMQQVVSMEEELKDPKLANAEVTHRKNLMKKTVLEHVQKDIRLYRVSLDSAVMTFHRTKMETINKYLKTYWKKIYKGNDIDYIAIKTENTDTSDQTTVKIDMNKTLRKTYNYRVVMVRRGIELDMRGRCSAGQKVLASIIIRLALAQTFTAHCGIITLDEPTTNLDKENIASLAKTLSELAFSMREHRAFQLVVITHDIDFIDTLLQIDPITFYYRVQRDRMGFSQIERKMK